MDSPRAFTSFSRTLAAVALSTVAAIACDDPDDRPAEWAFIAPALLAPNCATGSCHSRAVAVAGLDLSEPDVAYAGLLRQRSQFFLPGAPAQPSSECRAERGGTVCVSTRPLVQPCRPDESRIVHMMRARGAQRMPPDRPMPLADIELIERWILLGAKERPEDASPACGVLPDAGTAPSPQDVGVDAPAMPPPDAAQAMPPDAAMPPNDGGAG